VRPAAPDGVLIRPMRAADAGEVSCSSGAAASRVPT